MIFINIVLIIIIIILLFQKMYSKREIKNITKQLKYINEGKIDNKVTIRLINKEIEELTKNINKSIDIRKQCEEREFKLKKHLKRTVADMSHDLRTPLTSIKGYIQFLKLDDLKDSERKEYISIAEERVGALEILINDFYELSLIDSMDFKIELKRLNITKILKECILSRYNDFKYRDLEPNIDLCKDYLYIVADEKLIKRVISNLLHNTIKYAKDSCFISLKREDDKVTFKISNNAENITLKDVEHIFDRFYMADKTRSGKGTGLGLSIAKNLTKKMKGSIDARLNGDVLEISLTFKAMDI
ncbi:HAMP domain-containing sensor histidine kinase [Clostridium oceanicum]|uniref:histidine kinase n=1 Tax=Clostridium oceanicum TaxID=1543 RepID=A0ABP3UNZ9_9CLOT